MAIDNFAAASSSDTDRPVASSAEVPLRTGPPTREELLVHYPAKFTWEQLKTFVNSGDLGLLKRDKKLQIRYDEWAKGMRERYGSIVNYLWDHRLQWGNPDTLSLLPSRLSNCAPESTPESTQVSSDWSSKDSQPQRPTVPPDAPSYFTADTPPEYISIIMNDWPYSVPPEVEHTLIWTRIPIIPPDLPPSIAPRIAQDGLWGFTGSDSPPPSPSLLPSYLPALSEWGVTMDKLVRSPKGTDEEEALVKKDGDEIAKFIKRRWSEDEWETAWFVNPPRLQSVPGLAHIHVFARYKGPDSQT
ncbi:unnamed protein product [Somion occarium]